jgi:hypothetical protein
MNENAVRPSVYVTQETNHNFVDAEKFGEVRFLTAREPTKITGSLRNNDIVQEIIDNLNGYRPGVDMLLPVGSPLNIGIAIAAALKGGPDLLVLQWDKMDHTYRQFAVRCNL